MQSPGLDSEGLAVSSALLLTSLVPQGETPNFSGLLVLHMQNGDNNALHALSSRMMFE